MPAEGLRSKSFYEIHSLIHKIFYRQPEMTLLHKTTQYMLEIDFQLIRFQLIEKDGFSNVA